MVDCPKSGAMLWALPLLRQSDGWLTQSALSGKNATQSGKHNATQIKKQHLPTAKHGLDVSLYLTSTTFTNNKQLTLNWSISSLPQRKTHSNSWYILYVNGFKKSTHAYINTAFKPEQTKNTHLRIQGK
jgi:hypothetical protein